MSIRVEPTPDLESQTAVAKKQLEQLKNDLQREEDAGRRDELSISIHELEARIERLQSQVNRTKQESEGQPSPKTGLPDREPASKPAQGDQPPTNGIVIPAEKRGKGWLNQIYQFISTPAGFFTLLALLIASFALIAEIIGIIPILAPEKTLSSLPSTDLMAEVSPPIQTSIASPTPFSTPALVCGTPHPPISETIMDGNVEITQPEGNCLEVSQHETLRVTWSGVTDNIYTLWVLVYSPFAKRYYPHSCSEGTLTTNGDLDCRVNFAKLNEPYEAILILADPGASMALNDVALSGTGILQADLPQGIFEKDSLLARRTK